MRRPTKKMVTEHLATERRAILEKALGHAHADQDIGLLVHARFRHVDQRQAIVQVSQTLAKHADVRPQGLGDGQSADVVAGPVDAQTGGDPLD